jgi:hypothetical protein
MYRYGLVPLISLAIATTSAIPQPPTPPLRLPQDVQYNRLLFLRHDRADDGTQTDTLVMATVRRDGFELSDVYSKDNLDIGSQLLGVFGGRAYLMHIGELLCIELYTGSCTQIAPRADPYAYANGRLFLARGGEVRDYALGSERWRTVVSVPEWPHGADIAVSPDCTWLAFFTQQPFQELEFGWQLNVIDLEKGTIQPVGEPVQYISPPGSSYAPAGPPFTWLDGTTLVFVRTDVKVRRATEDRVEFAGEPINRVAVADMATREARDIVAIPGSVHTGGWIHFPPPCPDLPAVLEIGWNVPTAGRYLVDTEEGKLVETDSIGGDFRLVERDDLHYLYHGPALLAESRANIHAAVSPDRKAVIWTEGRADAKLQFYHEDDGFVRTVTEGFFGESFLWFGDEGLRPTTAQLPLRADWREFEHSPYPEPRPPDTRENIADHLSFTIACDKEAYKLHEPVLLTLTITSKSTVAFEVARPSIDERIVHLGMDCPGGGKLINRFWGSNEIHPIEKVPLEPGESVSATETIETAQPGQYTIDGDYTTYRIATEGDREFRGRLKAEPAEFTVEDTADAEELLEAKVDRLLAALHDLQAKAPEWDGWLPPADDLVDLGQAGVPYVLDALAREGNALIVQRLLWALNHIASPDALTVYREALAHEDREVRELAVRGLYELCARQTPARGEALAALTGVLNGDSPDDLRAVAARNLAHIHDPAVKAAFEQAAVRGDRAVAQSAGRYLAAWEEMTLEDWLAAVAEQPTAARLAAARVVIGDLRETWHLQTMRDLADFSWQEVSERAERLTAFREVVQSWQTWAAENPRLSQTYFDRDRENWAK